MSKTNFLSSIKEKYYKKIIPSDYLRDYCAISNWSFSAWETATFIANSLELLWEEKIECLEDLKNACKDKKLLKQLDFVLKRSKEKYQKFTSFNDTNKYIYSVSLFHEGPRAYFSNFKSAKAFSDAIFSETFESHCIHLNKVNSLDFESMSKQEIISKERDKCKHPWYDEDREIDLEYVFLDNYKHPVGTIAYNSQNEIVGVNLEDSLLENKDTENYLNPKVLFTYKYIDGPNPFRIGDIVYNIADHEICVVVENPSTLTSKDKEDLSYTNYGLKLYSLEGNGRWYYNFESPIYLTKDVPKTNKKYKINKEAIEASKAFSSFVKDKNNKDKQNAAIKTSMAYAASVYNEANPCDLKCEHIEDLFIGEING